MNLYETFKSSSEVAKPYFTFKKKNFLRLSMVFLFFSLTISDYYFSKLSRKFINPFLEKLVNIPEIIKNFFVNFIENIVLYQVNSFLLDYLITDLATKMTKDALKKLGNNKTYLGITYLSKDEKKTNYKNIINKIDNFATDFVDTYIGIAGNTISLVKSLIKVRGIISQERNGLRVILLLSLPSLLSLIISNKILKIINKKQNKAFKSQAKSSEVISEIYQNRVAFAISDTEPNFEEEISKNLDNAKRDIKLVEKYKFFQEIYGLIMRNFLEPLLEKYVSNNINDANNMDYYQNSVYSLFKVGTNFINIFRADYSEFYKVSEDLKEFDQYCKKWDEFIKNREFKIIESEKNLVLKNFMLSVPKKGTNLSDLENQNFKKGNRISKTTLEFEAGKIYRLEGENGAGKSVLIKAIMDVYPYAKGEVHVPKGKIIAVRNIVTMAGNTSLSKFILGDEEIDNKKKDIVKDKLIQLGLEDFISELDIEENWSETLSTGQMQLFNFIRIIFKKPGFIIFDEAFSNIDNKKREIMRDILKKELPNTGVMYVEHQAANNKEWNSFTDYIVEFKDKNLNVRECLNK